MPKAAKKAIVSRSKRVEVTYVGANHIYKFVAGDISGYHNGLSIEHRDGRRYNNSISIMPGEGDPTEWVSSMIRELQLFQQGLIEMHSKETK